MIRLLVAAAGLAYAFWGFDVDAFVVTLAGFDPVKVLAVLLLMAGGYVGLGYRLNVIIPDRPGLLPCLVASLFGLGINNLVPARVGEVAKVLYLRQRCAIPTARLLGVVFWERFADLHALLLLSVGLFFVMQLGQALLLLFGIAVGLWGFVGCLRRWPGRVRRLIGVIPHAGLRHLLVDILEFLRGRLPPRTLLLLGGATLTIWTLYALQVVYMLLGVAELELSLAQTLVVFLLAALSMAVSISPGGLGIYEAAVVLALGWYGVPREEALPVAVALHMLQFIPTTIFGALILTRTRLSLRAIRAAG